MIMITHNGPCLQIPFIFKGEFKEQVADVGKPFGGIKEMLFLKGSASDDVGSFFVKPMFRGVRP